MRRLVRCAAVFGLLGCFPATGLAQDAAAVRPIGDSVTVRLLDTELRVVIQAVGRYLPKPVLTGNIPQVRVSLETPTPVSRGTLATLLKGLVEAQSLEFVEDSAFIRIGPQPVAALTPQPTAIAGVKADSLHPVRLFVIRLRHARAADVAATVNLLFGAGGEFSGQAGLSSGTLSDDLRSHAVPLQAKNGVPADTNHPRPRSMLEGPVTIGALGLQ